MTNHPPSPSAKVPLHEKFALGSGALLDNIGQHAVKLLALPILNMGLGINPELIGLCLMAFRLWDAFADTAVGALSDATRSTKGRRRPWIIGGAILCGVLFPTLWFAPTDWTHQAQIWYFLIFGLLYFTAYSIFTVPYHALAFEMTPDYDEKTRIMAYRTIFNGFGGIVTGWLYWICQRKNLFETEVEGVRVVSVVLGVLLIVVGCVPGLFIKERYFETAARKKALPFWTSLWLTLKSIPFILLTFMTVSILIGTNAINSLGVYLGVYYVFGGDKAAASVIVGWSATLFGILTFLTVPIMAFVATHLGKKVTMAISLACGVIASASAWWFITPANPWLQLVPIVFAVPGTMGFWLMYSSMSADVCDYDEWKTGQRREGMFSAVYAWISKVGLSLSYGASGFVVAASGFRQELGGDQNPDTILWMRIVYAFGPVALYLFAGVLLVFYSLTRNRMVEIRTELEARRGVV